MSTLLAPPVPAADRPAPTRDTGIDLARAVCVVIVVLLHAIMVGVTVDATGPVFANAAEGAAWFVPLTWVAQIMPGFFVIGGFAGALAHRRLRQRGGTGVQFVSARVHRLLVPAALSIAVAGVGLAALALAGVPGDIILIAGFRYSQPLWFLGVFLLCQALLPAMLTAHDRAPVRALLALAAGAVMVDVARAVTGVGVIGFLNLALVWLTLQQLGFFLADGRIDALRARTRVVVALVAVAALATAFLTGLYSPDLIENLNPPTTALLLVGVAQTALLSLGRNRLRALSRRRAVAAFTAFITTRTMTIYVWHMPVLLTMAGAAAVFAMTTGIALPEPSSLDWWLTRPLWLAFALTLTAAAARALAGAERRRMGPTSASRSRSVQAVLVGLGAVVLLLAAGTSVVTAALAVGMLVWSLHRIPAPGSH
jgi:surface polysaccharide O-acyltransferase-like enzyme